MKPVNIKERSKAFYKVTGLFVICLLLASLLGFVTMREKNVGDYTARKQLESLRSNLMFQENVFRPNIESATKKLQELPDYKEKNLAFDDLTTSVNVSLENIKKEWKVDENDPQYVMYKNIVDIYFALKSTYINKFKLEENLEAKEKDVRSGSGDLQRVAAKKEELEQENKDLKTDYENLTTSFSSLQSQTENLQNQNVKLQSRLSKCRDSLRYYIDINKGLKQQLNRPK